MLYQSQSPTLRPMTTAHLAQTMALLELNSDELRQKIESSLASNPALELGDEFRCPHCHRRLSSKGPCPVCSQSQAAASEQPIIFVSPSRDFGAERANHSSKDTMDDVSYDEWTAEYEDLATFVLRQIAPELDPEDRLLAAHILTCLDEDGLLSVPLVEIARYQHVPLWRVEKVLHQIQRAEPTGVGSPTPQEALLVQLEVLGETESIPALAAQAVQEGMDLLSRRAYPELARLLKISTSRTEELATFISSNLNPFPARAHWGNNTHDANGPQVYHNADVVISQLNENDDSALVVEIVSPYSGSLRINSLFRQALQQAPENKAEQWQSALDEALLLVKCLQQRNHTMVRLMERLVTLQRQFILEGDAYLNPVTRAQLAIELELHESTISRAVSSKAVQLPNKRIIPLARLFDRSLHIRTALVEIINQEDEPLSDIDIARRLSEQGYPVARRTVAKYRSMEGILPARLRRPRTRQAQHE